MVRHEGAVSSLTALRFYLGPSTSTERSRPAARLGLSMTLATIPSSPLHLPKSKRQTSVLFCCYVVLAKTGDLASNDKRRQQSIPG